MIKAPRQKAYIFDGFEKYYNKKTKAMNSENSIITMSLGLVQECSYHEG